MASSLQRHVAPIGQDVFADSGVKSWQARSDAWCSGRAPTRVACKSKRCWKDDGVVRVETSFCGSSSILPKDSYSIVRSFVDRGRQTAGSVTARAQGGGSNTAASSAVQEMVETSENGGVLQTSPAPETVSDDEVVAPGHHQLQQRSEAEVGIKTGKLIDGLVYRERFVIRCYEVGMNRTASMETMANLLQEVACNHAQSVGFSTNGFATTPLMRKRHLIWVTTRMHIQMKKFPVWGETVEIDTWYQGEGRIETRRDWIIRDDRTGDEIGRATSTWVMMNMDTRRLSRIPDDVRQEYMPFVPRPARWAFDPKEKNNSSTKTIGKIDLAHSVRPNLIPRRNDLDMNQHVNNVTYIGWMLEAIAAEVSNTHELTQITLDYKRECKADDIVESLVSPETPETAAYLLLQLKHASAAANREINGTPAGIRTYVKEDVIVSASARCSSSGSSGAPDDDSSRHLPPTLLFLHVLRLSAGGKEINRGRTEWRIRKPAASS